jgi:hypothetical protein
MDYISNKPYNVLSIMLPKNFKPGAVPLAKPSRKLSGLFLANDSDVS